MQMAQIIGGYSLGGADLLRRAMGKKKAEEMAEHREHLPRGRREERHLTGEKADEIFDLMEKFAGYGFNKSHAAAYALLAYHTGWLKAHHPAEFMAANMSLAMDDTDKVKILFEDCLDERHDRAAAGHQPVGVPLRAGRGSRRQALENDPLRPRRGQGQRPERDRGNRRARAKKRPFTDLFDFCVRVDRRVVNRRTVEALIRAGAFDSLHANRAQLIASVPLAMEAAEQASRQRDAGRSLRHGRRAAARPRSRRRTRVVGQEAPAGRKDARSASICRVICSTPTRPKCAASCGRRSAS